MGSASARLGAAIITRPDVIVDNRYVKPADDPTDDPEDDPKDDPEDDRPAGDSGSKGPDSDVPDTGDSIMLWLTLSFMSLASMASAAIFRKKTQV